MRTTHELKEWPEFFKSTRDGSKRFQLRRNDREFKVGDHLLLREWDPEPSKLPGRSLAIGYTGREITVRVDYIMDFKTLDRLIGLIPEVEPPGYIIMSISLVH